LAVTVRLRDCVPLEPQVLVHAVQALNADTAQCTGHGPWLHACVSAVCGHAAPPLAGGVEKERLRDFEPGPHDFVHADQANQLPGAQSTAHACALYMRISAS
jgi:hypothetical protein